MAVSADHRIAIGLAVLASLLLAIVWWLWWRLPKREVARLSLKIRDPKARTEIEDNFRKTVGQALGGAAVLIGAFSAYWQFSEQQRTSYLQFSQQQRASYDLLISNQVSKGFEQLGNKDAIFIRLGGIYALEGVMNNSEQYNRPVLEALTAFIRADTRAETTIPQGPKPLGLPTDIQAALTVIGRRSANVSAHLNEVDLINLSRANLLGADLTHANLANANLDHANLIDARLSDAHLDHAHLFEANLTGADLIDAHLTDTNLDSARLYNANLTGTDLTGANLSYANLTYAHLTTANLTDANLTRADLTDADLTGARVDGQEQLDRACGSRVVGLPAPLTVKPCPPRP
jgi:uncharacterized protein YjbI with pentapeptide repeats